MTVAIFSDARPDHGQGHRSRCRALAEELSNRGKITPLIHICGPMIPSAAEICRLAEPDTVVVLDFLGCHEVAADVRTSGRKVVVFDDGLCPNVRADLVVSGIAGEPLYYPNANRTLAGPAYAVLRPEFVVARIVRRRRGGVLDFRSVSGLTAGMMAQMMAGASVAISCGGQRALELACVGTPAVLVVDSPDQEHNVRGLVAAGAAVAVEAAEVGRVAYALEAEASRLMEMSSRGRGLVDGHGRRRVADEILSL